MKKDNVIILKHSRPCLGHSFTASIRTLFLLPFIYLYMNIFNTSFSFFICILRTVFPLLFLSECELLGIVSSGSKSPPTPDEEWNQEKLKLFTFFFFMFISGSTVFPLLIFLYYVLFSLFELYSLHNFLSGQRKFPQIRSFCWPVFACIPKEEWERRRGEIKWYLKAISMLCFLVCITKKMYYI